MPASRATTSARSPISSGSEDWNGKINENRPPHITQKNIYGLCQATDLAWQDGQSVGVEVELRELAKLFDGGRHVRDVGLGQVQAGLVLLLAFGKLAGKVLKIVIDSR